MHGCKGRCMVAGGCAWLQGGHAWLLGGGGVHGCGGCACVVVGGMHGCGGGHAFDMTRHSQ